MLANHAGALNPLIEAAEQLIEALTISEFNPHTFLITPPQGDCPAHYYTAGCGSIFRDNPV